MQVIATAKGYYGALIQPGQTFDVPDQTKGSWFRPIEGGDKNAEAASDKAGKSSTTTKNVDAITKATK